LRSKKNKRANQANLLREMRENADLAGLVALDEFSGVVVLKRPIPDLPNYPVNAGFIPRPWHETDITRLCVYLNTHGFPSVSANRVFDVVTSVAREHSFHSVREYFAGLTWDRVPRISRFFLDHCGAVVSPTNPTTLDEIAEAEACAGYIQEIARRFFIGAVARIMRPGCKLDTMLVLEGPQGSLKSQLIEALAVRSEWFSDSLPHNLESRDTRLHLSGVWVIELSELMQFRGASIETLKSFLSCHEDKYRPPYGRIDTVVPRQCVLVGTTNNNTYLHDPTGSRRFWSVRITNIRLEEIRALVPQLWAEAYLAWNNGEGWWLDPKLDGIAADQQSDRLERDPWWEPVADFVGLRKPGDWFSTGQIFAVLGVETKDRRRGDEMRIGGVLTELGCQHQRKQVNGNRRWGWVR
jgi:predicted P-loop ATPase